MSVIDPNKLLISSDFYSVQGEGKSSGVPSYFVRLGICNLTCGMSRAFAKDEPVFTFKVPADKFTLPDDVIDPAFILTVPRELLIVANI